MANPERNARWRRHIGLVLIVIGALALLRAISAFLGNRPVELHQTFVGEDYDSLLLLIALIPLAAGALLLPDIEIDRGSRRVSIAKVFVYLGLAAAAVGWVLMFYYRTILGEIGRGFDMSILFNSIGLVAISVGYFLMPRKS